MFHYTHCRHTNRKTENSPTRDLSNPVWAIVIERITEQCLLSACAMNLIRLVKAANAVFFRCLGVIFQGLFHLGVFVNSTEALPPAGGFGQYRAYQSGERPFLRGLQPHSPDGGRQGKTLPPLQCGVRPEGAGLCGYARSIGKGHLEQACVASKSRY